MLLSISDLMIYSICIFADWVTFTRNLYLPDREREKERGRERERERERGREGERFDKDAIVLMYFFSI